jgi:VIT1/CCC1 family predicted Fe2+/Mn2+ transporter
VFLLVFLSTFPVAVPFFFMQNATAAMRTSNAIAIGMLLITGVAYGRVVGRSPWWPACPWWPWVPLVALNIALGG